MIIRPQCYKDNALKMIRTTLRTSNESFEGNLFNKSMEINRASLTYKLPNKKMILKEMYTTLKQSPTLNNESYKNRFENSIIGRDTKKQYITSFNGLGKNKILHNFSKTYKCTPNAKKYNKKVCSTIKKNINSRNSKKLANIFLRTSYKKAKPNDIIYYANENTYDILKNIVVSHGMLII